MEGMKDDLKGRVKEAAGDLTDDEELKRESRADRATGKVKEMLEQAKEKGEELVDKARERIQRR